MTALYRKYRPKDFNEVLGQEHIVTTLKNQIASKSVSHAYLFTGSRGTGKTTVARIFAKAINCEKKAAKELPCGACKTCIELSNQNNIDILEIDAASNNKVEEVRELRERVKFLPVVASKKVYIIDEVHMLTDGAFNALLKTLEEPPEHVIFILATTEVHKLPATILSRCMRLDFRLSSKEHLLNLLTAIMRLEKREAAKEALEYIAQRAEGSFRDLLSILDLALSYSKGKLTLEDCHKSLGATDKTSVSNFLLAINTGNIGAILQTIADLVDSGKSLPLVAKDIVLYAKDLLALKVGAGELVIESDEKKAALASEAEKFDTNLLLKIIVDFSKIDLGLKYASSPRVLLEATALSASHALQSRSEDLEARGKGLEIRYEVQGIGQAVNSPPWEGLGVGRQQKKQDLSATRVWGQLATYFRQKKDTQKQAIFASHKAYEVNGDKLVITADNESFLIFSDAEFLQAINLALNELNISLKIEIKKQAAKLNADEELKKLEKVIGTKPKIL